MDVQFDSNLEARLMARAAQQGRKPDEFVQDFVARYLEEEDRLIEAVKRGEDALERGEYLSHELVGERLFGAFCILDANPLVCARGARP